MMKRSGHNNDPNGSSLIVDGAAEARPARAPNRFSGFTKRKIGGRLNAGFAAVLAVRAIEAGMTVWQGRRCHWISMR